MTFVNPVLVFPLRGGLILLAAAYLAIARHLDRAEPEDRALTVVALALSVAPLIGILRLTLSRARLEPPLRYVAAGIPLALGGSLAARTVGFRVVRIGLTLRNTG